MLSGDSFDSDFAEVLGLLLGDGCISKFVSNKRTLFEVAFTGNASELQYYRGFVKCVIEDHFPIKGRLLSRNDNTVRLHFRSKRLAMYLSSIGLPIGKKTDAAIPAIVRSNRQLVPFVRGFYHAEGSVYRRYSKQYRGHARMYNHLLVVQFRAKLKTLMSELHQVLTKLEIRPTKISESEGVYTFRLTDQSQIAKFFDLVRLKYKTCPIR